MSHSGRQSRMSESGVSGAVILEEPETSAATSGVRAESQNQERPTFRCPFWPRQQTWLCVVPLLIGFIGLGLSLMLLKWIVVGTVRDYVPTDLVDANRIGQDPIFLSKPSGIPKNVDTTTTTTTSTATPATTTTPEARTGRGRTRLATTTAVNHRGGGAYGSQVTPRNPGHRNGRHGFTTTTAAPRSTSTIGAGTSSPSPHNPTVLHDQTAMWTPEQTTTDIAPTTLTTRGHGHHKTPSPSVPPLHSEHFKPCHEKDLAYCLNGGECFVIETLSGPHKHCKCREGYQGIRCDQFLPKTDSILSDPNHLGIEFMESKDVYKRQVLSITSITMAISLLGIICMALYYRNKQHREKLQAQLKENRSLKNYNSHNALREESRIPNSNLQMPQDCKRQFQSSDPHSSHSISDSAGHSPCSTSCISNGTSKLKRGFLLHSSSQKARPPHWTTLCTSPSMSKRRLHQIGGSKNTSSAYQHLQEVDSSRKDNETKQRSQSKRECHYSSLRQDTLLHIQPSVPMETALPVYPRSSSNNSGFHQPMEPQHTEPPYLSSSIPIIPSVHCQYDKEVSCMQTKSFPSNINDMKAKSVSKPCPAMIGQQQVKASLLLEEAQEQLSALAHCKHGGRADIWKPRETVCFLSQNAGPSREPSPPTNVHILSQSNRDLATSNQ